MKEFNLEEAINGKAFYLHDGYRGVIKYCVDDFITSSGNTPLYPYIGYVLDDKGFIYRSLAAWDKNGKSNMAYSYNATTMVDDTPPQDNKEETMKKFDLKAALNGEPVMLRSGCKAIVYYKVPDEYKFADNKSTLCPLKGLVFDINGNLASSAMYWYESGKFDSKTDHSLDIIGMWEEPKISVEDLPKPFKPKDGEPFYYIYCGKIYCVHEYSESSSSYRSFSQNGQCFRSEKDAQKWLNFMKSMME